MIGQCCTIHEPCPPSHGHGPSPAQIKAGVTRTIHHFCYFGWPDFGVPESPTGVLTMLHHVRALRGSGNTDAPTITHCRCVRVCVLVEYLWT